MKKMFITTIIGSIISAGIVVVIVMLILNFAQDGLDTYQKQEVIYKSHLNENYDLNGKTYKIINYSVTNETYTLSNGIKINANIINEE
jgi:hypothetical protein